MDCNQDNQGFCSLHCNNLGRYFCSLDSILKIIASITNAPNKGSIMEWGRRFCSCFRGKQHPKFTLSQFQLVKGFSTWIVAGIVEWIVDFFCSVCLQNLFLS